MADKSIITIALSKGRLADKAIDLLVKCGVNCANLKDETRQLQLFDADKKIKFVFVKPSDVPTYVERGVADIGVVGKDTLLEEQKDVYEMLDLNLAKCKLSVAGKQNFDFKNLNRNLRVGTKYVNVARDYFYKQGMEVDIIKLHGSVELAPLIELSDVIVDVVESGKTLKANGLVVLQDICNCSARLIVNKASLKTKSDKIEPLLSKLRLQMRK